MTKYLTTTMSVAVHREGINPVFGEGVTTVSIEDEAAGPFVVLEQRSDEGLQTLRMDLQELEAIQRAARRMVRAAEKGEPT